jgi:hypothetical protein
LKTVYKRNDQVSMIKTSEVIVINRLIMINTKKRDY